MSTEFLSKTIFKFAYYYFLYVVYLCMFSSHIMQINVLPLEIIMCLFLYAIRCFTIVLVFRYFAFEIQFIPFSFILSCLHGSHPSTLLNQYYLSQFCFLTRRILLYKGISLLPVLLREVIKFCTREVPPKTIHVSVTTHCLYNVALLI